MAEGASAGAMHQTEIVALLKELRDEFTDAGHWSVKRATWTMAILAAEGKLNKGRKSVTNAGETVEEGSGDRSGTGAGGDADRV